MSGKRFERQFTEINFPKPRGEFYRGEMPLSFEHEFPGGARLKAEQNENGFGRFSVTKDGETIFDTDTALPDGYRIITPTRLNLLKKEGDSPLGNTENYKRALWKSFPQEKTVVVGDVRSPRDFLLILHEMGHAVDSEQKGIIEESKETALASMSAKSKKDKRDNLLASAKANAKYERRAWAYGITKLREIAEDGGFDIRDIFPNHESLRDFVHTYLESYRYAHEAYAADGLLTQVYDDDFHKELERAFHGAGP